MKDWISANVVVALLLSSCTYPVKRADWSHYHGPGADLFRQEEVPPPYFPDPVEPVNRTVAAVNFALLRYLIDPLSSGYRFVVPPPVRRSVSHFSENLVYPRRLLANLGFFPTKVRFLS